MKHVLIMLSLAFLLTGCFGGKGDRVDDGGVETPDVVMEDTAGDEDGDDNSGETQEATNESSNEDTAEVDVEAAVELSEEEKQAEAEVLDEFEGDLDEIFKELGV